MGKKALSFLSEDLLPMSTARDQDIFTGNGDGDQCLEAMKSTTTAATAKFIRHSSPVVRFATPQTVERETRSNYRGTPRFIHSSSTVAAPTIATSVDHDTSQFLMNQSVASYTPIMTPNQSGDVGLLSPSRTISETFKELATETVGKLEDLWDEVGYSPEDRASQLHDLIFRIQHLCEAKVAEERGFVVTVQENIAEYKQQIIQLCEALQEPHSGGNDVSADQFQPPLLDQMDELSARLEGLRATADEARQDLKECRDFLIESHEALGIEMDPQWLDIDRDLTSHRRQKFHEKRVELKAELSSRSAAVVQLVGDCQRLMRELAIDTFSKDCTDLDRRIAGSLVRSKDDSFMMASKHRTDTCVGISGAAMEEITTRLSELHAERRRRKTKLQDIGLEISKLWEKLRIPEDEQRAFTESVRGIGLDTIDKGQAELDRLNGMKAEMIGQLVLEAREEIVDLWDQIDADEEYRNAFQAFQIKEFNDELLEAHESYLVELHERLEERKPILRLIERREGIVKERMEYENLQQDSDRLKQRSGALARQLLEEEKMARRIKRDLPKLTEILTEKLIEWKERHGEEFMYQGCVYLEEMTRQEEEWDSYKEQKHHKMQQKKLNDEVTPAVATTAPFGVKGKAKHQASRQPRQPLQNAKINTNHPAGAFKLKTNI